jgi:phosphoribosylformylglycinamidine synthase
MKQKYPNDEVIAPGTVIISAAGNCSNITKVVEPTLQRNGGSFTTSTYRKIRLN